MKNIGNVQPNSADKKKIEKLCTQLTNWVKKIWPIIEKYSGDDFVLDMTTLYLYIGKKSKDELIQLPRFESKSKIEANNSVPPVTPKLTRTTKTAENDNNWRIACFRFIGRQKRLHKFDELKKRGTSVPDIVYSKELDLVQDAYEEMKNLCLKDATFMERWDKDE